MNLNIRHPKYYKELRKLRNKSDQAISGANSTEEKTSRATGPGQNLTCDCNADGSEGSSLKPQAPSAKPQAPSSDKKE